MLVLVLWLSTAWVGIFTTWAQGDPPAIIDNAFVKLGQKLGKPIARGGDSNYSWTQNVYPDTSLGCPRSGAAYAQLITAGYKFLLTYRGKTYDYRVSADSLRAR